jgi:hypothetical protein
MERNELLHAKVNDVIYKCSPYLTGDALYFTAKINRLMLFKEIITACYENYKKQEQSVGGGGGEQDFIKF